MSTVALTGKPIIGIKDFDPEHFKDPSKWSPNRTIFCNDSIYYDGVADSIHSTLRSGGAQDAYVIMFAHPCADGRYDSFINYKSGKHDKDLVEYPDYTVFVQDGIGHYIPRGGGLAYTHPVFHWNSYSHDIRYKST